ncbi:MAG: M48 family metallopeptidase [Spirulinaceae cyanobacterium RM2_2_10]|nr:M48 family metallopeptidase [Spirulinaceae cyanobacterium SM2_1_0]NJO20520.1 M48 family metallopeptidase [Spirulinaceae cyanobacterium RM2_2_10]
MMKYTPREIHTEVNVTPRNPLVNLVHLLGTVAGASIAIYVLLGWAVDWVVPRISPEFEAQLGALTAPQGAIALGGQELTADPRRDELQDLLEQLQTNEHLPAATVHLVDSTLVNAAALPGGHIFVTTGLLAAVESQNELAFVLAHELGHHVNRDTLRQLGRSLVVAWGAQLVFGSGTSDNGASVVSTSFNLQNLHYSRRAESAADRFALDAVCQHYGHGNGSLGFFQRLAAEENQTLTRLTAYFRTHPASQSRVTDLSEYATEQGCPLTGSLQPFSVGD